MPVLRYLSSSVRSLSVVLTTALDDIGRNDLVDLILSSDEDSLAWEKGNLYFVSYIAVGDVAGVDVLLSGEEAEALTQVILDKHKEEGVPQLVPGIQTGEQLPPVEQAWKLSTRVKYWEPKLPIHSYPGFEDELYFNVYTEVMMDDFNKVRFEVDTNMQYSSVTFDFGDGNTFSTNLPMSVHLYEQPGTYTVRITLDNGQVVLKTVVTGSDPNMPNMPMIYAEELEITATEPS